MIAHPTISPSLLDLPPVLLAAMNTIPAMIITTADQIGLLDIHCSCELFGTLASSRSGSATGKAYVAM